MEHSGQPCCKNNMNVVNVCKQLNSLLLYIQNPHGGTFLNVFVHMTITKHDSINASINSKNAWR